MSRVFTRGKVMNLFPLWLALFALSTIVCTATWAQNPPRVIEVHAHRYAFTPGEITVKKGQAVTLRLVSDDVPHSLVVQDLGISQTIARSHPVEVTITPNTPGDFRGKCGRFCGSGHGSMTFIVHVKE